mmetsp:Transcript_80072/g.147320  ORF Transcript_80072/g.147320 Transcript_80072/m.147320 type:complete len:172 (-) Transcript_80072:199-714(-)
MTFSYKNGLAVVLVAIATLCTLSVRMQVDEPPMEVDAADTVTFVNVDVDVKGKECSAFVALTSSEVIEKNKSQAQCQSSCVAEQWCCGYKIMKPVKGTDYAKFHGEADLCVKLDGNICYYREEPLKPPNRQVTNYLKKTKQCEKWYNRGEGVRGNLSYDYFISLGSDADDW